MNLFIIGASGCGKSTQADKIAKKYNLTHYSTGQIFRDEIAAQSPIGLEAQEYVKQGKWIPNDIIFRIITEKLQAINNNNFIIDGFPRQVDQMIKMDEYLNSQNTKADFVIHLDITTQEIVARRQAVAQKGGTFQQNRPDETPEAIAARQKSYEESIDPIFEYLNKDTERLIRVDANRPIEPIFQDICLKLDQLLI